MDKKIKSELHQFFGFESFKGKQEEIINSLLNGNDTLVILPTGGGKSLCYQLPAIVMEGLAIIVSPLIALMKNQVDFIRQIDSRDNVAHYLNSTLSKTQIQEVKNDIVSGKTKLLYVAPESLIKEENINFLKSINISFYAVDEAHCISEWGHDFRPEYRKLREIIENLQSAPIIALTATATEKVKSDIVKTLQMRDVKEFISSFNRPNLFYEVRLKEKEDEQIVQFVKQNQGKSGIIYCLSRKSVENMAQTLQENGINAIPYHAGFDKKSRENTQDKFLNEEVDVIVATIAFGMGIDKPDVRYVIHKDMSKSIEGYYQETGRAGRDGGEGYCLAFYNQKDIEKLDKFLHGKTVSELEKGRQLLDSVISFSESPTCRRKFLLKYFDEEFDENNCEEMCDNCKNPLEQYNATQYLELLLILIDEFGEVYNANFLSSFIAGVKNNEITTYKMQDHKKFGKGKEFSKTRWRSIVNQAIINGFVNKDIESYGVLKLTEKGLDFIANPFNINFYKEREFDIDNITMINKSSKDSVLDTELYNMLQMEKKIIAKKNKLPPYVIMSDVSIEEMCIYYPTSIEDIQKISGVGVGKASRYGKNFIDIIIKYVQDKEIDIVSEMRIKSVPKKSLNKIKIITNIDKKVDFEDIARTVGLDIDELISELEVIVSSGTKININYYIDSILDEDDQEDIMEYFKNQEEDFEIDAAIANFEGEFEADILRLVKIKFLNKYSI